MAVHVTVGSDRIHRSHVYAGQPLAATGTVWSVTSAEAGVCALWLSFPEERSSQSRSRCEVLSTQFSFPISSPGVRPH